VEVNYILNKQKQNEMVVTQAQVTQVTTRRYNIIKYLDWMFCMSPKTYFQFTYYSDFSDFHICFKLPVNPGPWMLSFKRPRTVAAVTTTKPTRVAPANN
jgi:hypothetical protein